MEKIKDYIYKYKYQIIGISSIIIASLIYQTFKNNSDDEIKEEKKEIIKKHEDHAMFSALQDELKKLNKSLTKLNPVLIKDKEKTEYYNKLFKKEINKKSILIDSLSVQQDDNHDTSNYKVRFGTESAPEVFKNVIGFRLVKATLPNVAHQINENNKSFYIIYNGSDPKQVDLTPGNYTFSSLGFHIEDKLNAAFGVTTFSIISDTITYKYTINNSVSHYFLWLDSFKQLKSTAHRVFGAIRKNETSSDYSASRTFPNIVDQTKHHVDLVIPEIPSIACKSSPGGKQIIDRIPLTSPSGSLVYYFAPVTEYSSIDYFYPMKLSSLTIQIYDNDSSQLYDSQNGDNYFEFEITILNDTSKMN